MISKEELMDMEGVDVIITTTFGSVLRGDYIYEAGDENESGEDSIGLYGFSIIENTNPNIKKILDAKAGLSITASDILSIKPAA